MSWSMIELGEYWAHAHDSDQILFMSLAAEFLDSSPAFKQVEWFQDWKAYWLDHKQTLGNGCSDMDLPRFLCTADRARLFRRFLVEYKLWLAQFGAEIPAHDINRRIGVPSILRYRGPCPVSDLLDFASTIGDLMDGNLQHPRVQRRQAGS